MVLLGSSGDICGELFGVGVSWAVGVSFGDSCVVCAVGPPSCPSVSSLDTLVVVPSVLVLVLCGDKCCDSCGTDVSWAACVVSGVSCGVCFV